MPSLPVLFRRCFPLLLGLLHLQCFGGGAGLVQEIRLVSKSGQYAKVARVSSLTLKDLRFASKIDNINGLLELAEKENRIDTVQMMQMSRSYASSEDGDKLLLICLQRTACLPERFLEIAKVSKLHAEVVTRNPELGLVQTHHLVGELTENLMRHYFQNSGWTRIEGQVGRTGFDGLFIKREGGVIKDVLVVESKYNTSKLQDTNFGTQMSRDWTLRKLAELKERFPNEKVYSDIGPFIQNDAYRAVLWNMKVEKDGLKIGLTKVRSKGATVEFVSAEDADIAKLSESFGSIFKFDSPKSDFERDVLGWYNEGLISVTRNQTR